MPPEPLGTGSGTGCQSEWDFRKAEGALAKVRRLSEMKDYTGFRKRLVTSELVSPGGIKWIELVFRHWHQNKSQLLLQ